jgi:hypothetical protein
MLELESGSRARGVASELSLGGCFVCARCTLGIQARVRGTLMHGNKKVKMLAVVRVVIPRSEWASNFWALIETAMQHCRPGSKIFANRAVTCRHIGKLYHMNEEVPPQKGDTAAVMRFDRCTIRVSLSMTYPAVFQVHTSVRLPPVRRGSYLFRRTKAQTFGYDALRFYTMKRIDTNCDVHGLERYHG